MAGDLVQGAPFLGGVRTFSLKARCVSRVRWLSSLRKRKKIVTIGTDGRSSHETSLVQP